MSLLPHQKKVAKRIREKLKKYKIALFIGETRSTKTRAFLDVTKDYKNPLIVTKKDSMSGIYSEGLAMGGIKMTVINYHSVQKVEGNFDIVIYDECGYYIGSYPKRSKIWNECKKVNTDADIIFSSATPTSEGYAKLFNMFALSEHSPWKNYSRFTLWHEVYGKPYTMRLNGFNVKKYDRVYEERVLADVEKYKVTLTRKEAGHVHEATDKIIHIPLSKKREKFYRLLKQDLLIEKHDILADTPVKLMSKLHQISNGFVKKENGGLYTFKTNPKIDWLHENIDPKNTFILAQHIADQELLAQYFPHTGSVTKLSAGVDLSMYEWMIIYSMNYSAQNYEQVRSRQMNINRMSPIEVRYLCSGIEHDIYKAVQKKKNFTAIWYRRHGEY